METLLILALLTVVFGANLVISAEEYDKQQLQAVRRTHRDFF